MIENCTTLTFIQIIILIKYEKNVPIRFIFDLTIDA